MDFLDSLSEDRLLFSFWLSYKQKTKKVEERGLPLLDLMSVVRAKFMAAMISPLSSPRLYTVVYAVVRCSTSPGVR